MEAMENFFEQFAEFIETEREADRCIPEFKKVCRLIGAPVRKLDKYLMENVGLSGEDIIRSYNTSTPIQFL